jgi:hypothetical protein
MEPLATGYARRSRLDSGARNTFSVSCRIKFRIPEARQVTGWFRSGVQIKHTTGVQQLISKDSSISQREYFSA